MALTLLLSTSPSLGVGCVDVSAAVVVAVVPVEGVVDVDVTACFYSSL